MRQNSSGFSHLGRPLVLGSAILVVAGLYLAQAVLIPITLSILFAFLLSPLVDRLRRWHVGHVASVAIVGSLALLVLVILAGLFTMQVADLVGDLPGYTQRIREKVHVVWAPLQHYLDRAQESVTQISTSPEPGAATVGEAVPMFDISRRSEIVTSWLMALAAPVGVFAVVTVLAGAMLLQGGDLRDRIIRLVGYSQVSLTTQALDDVAKRVSAYLLAQTVLNFSQGAALAVGLLLIGVPNAVFFAIFWAILRFLPYIGPWLGAIFPVLTALGHFDGLREPLFTIALFGVVELIGNMILEPWFYGRRTGLSPLAVIVSAVFWTWLWGWVGLLLATPMTVCLAVLGKYVEPLEFLHVLLGDEPVLRPSTRLYQRLLSHKPSEAREIILEELKYRGTIEVFQNTIVRALASVEEDRLKGMINDEKAEEIFVDVKGILDELPEPADGPDNIVPMGTCLCIPVRDEGDVLCGRLLQILCKARGVDVEVASNGYLASEKASLAAKHPADVVIVSALSVSRMALLRHTLRSIASRTDVPVVAGVWQGETDAITRSGDDAEIMVVTTFPEAIDAIRLAIHTRKGLPARAKPKVSAREETVQVPPALAHV